MAWNWDTPEGFLKIGGIVLVLVGVLGLFLIGPTAEQSVFGAAWWFDNGENGAHLLIGVVALVLAFAVQNADLNKWVTVAAGALALFFGIYSLFVGPSFLGSNLENPADTILHVVVGVWALYAGFAGKK